MEFKLVARDEVEAAGLMDVEQVLVEQTPGHYPEFREFIRRELDGAGGMIYFRGGSGSYYRLAVMDPAQSDIEGIEVCVCLTSSGQTLTSEIINQDLWDLLEWIIQGVGGDWTLEDLRQTGAIYRIAGSPSGPV
jgi:hypothetical protein